MSYPKQDPEKKKWGVCGSVTMKTRKLLIQESIRTVTTVGVVAGEILEKWAEGRELDIDLDRERFSNLRNRGPEVIKREARMYREGPLGKEKGKDILRTR